MKETYEERHERTKKQRERRTKKLQEKVKAMKIKSVNNAINTIICAYDNDIQREAIITLARQIIYGNYPELLEKKETENCEQ